MTVIHSIDELQEYLREKEKAYICGGGEIYKLFLELGLTSEVILSRVDMDIEDADAFFPEFEDGFMLAKTDIRE